MYVESRIRGWFLVRDHWLINRSAKQSVVVLERGWEIHSRARLFHANRLSKLSTAREMSTYLYCEPRPF